MYPIDQLIAFNKDETQHFHWLHYDRAYLQSVLLTASGIEDHIQHRAPAPATRFHLHQTLVLLGEELTKDAAELSASTIYVVMALTLTAGVFGDHSAAHAHLSGLGQLLELLRNSGAKAPHPKTLFKIDQIELFLWLNTGLPLSPTRSRSSPPVFNVAMAERKCLRIDRLVSSRIASVFYDLRHIVTSLNQQSQRLVRFEGAAFQRSMHSIQRRLIALANSTFDGSLEELLVVGMLLLLSTAFRLPAKRSISYAHAKHRLQRLMTVVELSTPAEVEVHFWCVMFGAMTVLDINEVWVQDAWRKVAGDVVDSWSKTKQLLRHVMWIDCVHNAPGQKAHELLSTLADRHGID